MDKKNDQVLPTAESLESVDRPTLNTSAPDVPEQSDQIAAAPGEPDYTQPNQPTKIPAIEIIRRIWRKVNVYLILFFALVLVIGAIVTFLVITEKGNTKQDTKIIDTQSLSEEALKQIAESNLTVGNSKQVLNVESSAIFAGQVLVRGNLEIGGQFKMNGDLSVNNLTVPGTVRTGQLQADGFSTSGNIAAQGSITGQNGINISGNSSFTGSVTATQINTTTLQVTNLQLAGDFKFSQHIVTNGSGVSTAKGNSIGSGGTASANGNDIAGTININTGTGTTSGCMATVTFAKAYGKTPKISITPITGAAAQAQYYANRTTSGFSICSVDTPAASQNLNYDYLVIE